MPRSICMMCLTGHEKHDKQTMHIYQHFALYDNNVRNLTDTRLVYEIGHANYLSSLHGYGIRHPVSAGGCLTTDPHVICSWIYSNQTIYAVNRPIFQHISKPVAEISVAQPLTKEKTSTEYRKRLQHHIQSIQVQGICKISFTIGSHPVTAIPPILVSSASKIVPCCEFRIETVSIRSEYVNVVTVPTMKANIVVCRQVKRKRNDENGSTKISRPRHITNEYDPVETFILDNFKRTGCGTDKVAAKDIWNAWQSYQLNRIPVVHRRSRKEILETLETKGCLRRLISNKEYIVGLRLL